MNDGFGCLKPSHIWKPSQPVRIPVDESEKQSMQKDLEDKLIRTLRSRLTRCYAPLFPAFTRAHLALCAAAILFLPAADMVRFAFGV